MSGHTIVVVGSKTNLFARDISYAGAWYSNDHGATWTQGTTPYDTTASGNNWFMTDVEYANGIFVAVGARVVGFVPPNPFPGIAIFHQFVFTSVDGKAWVESPAPFAWTHLVTGLSVTPAGIAYGKGYWVICGAMGQSTIYSVDNGKTWSVAPGVSHDLADVVWDSDAGVFVAIGGQANIAFTSPQPNIYTFPDPLTTATVTQVFSLFTYPIRLAQGTEAGRRLLVVLTQESLWKGNAATPHGVWTEYANLAAVSTRYCGICYIPDAGGSWLIFGDDEGDLATYGTIFVQGTFAGGFTPDYSFTRSFATFADANFAPKGPLFGGAIWDPLTKSLLVAGANFSGFNTPASLYIKTLPGGSWRTITGTPLDALTVAGPTSVPDAIAIMQQRGVITVGAQQKRGSVETLARRVRSTSIRSAPSDSGVASAGGTATIGATSRRSHQMPS